MIHTVALTSLYLSAGVLFAIGIYFWWRGNGNIATAFAFAMLLSALWAFTYALDIQSDRLDEKIFLMSLRLSFVALLPGMWLLTGMYYIKTYRQLSRAQIIMVFIIPFITILAIWFGSATHLYRYDFYLEKVNDFILLRWKNGPWYWVQVLYAYLISAYLIVILLRYLRAAKYSERRYTLALLAAFIIPMLTDILFQFNISPLPGYNLTPNVFILTGLLLAWAFFRLKIFDLLPVAHSLLFANVQDCIFVLDSEARIVDVNPAALDTFGLTRAAVRGKPAREVFTHWQGVVAQFENVVYAKEEVKIVNADGKAEHWEVLITPIRNRDQQMTGRIVMLHDITERKLTELRLRESEALYSTLIQSLPLAIFSKDTTGTYTFANELFAQAAGTSLENILGHTDYDILPDRAESFRAVDLRVMQFGYPYEAVEQNRQADGNMSYTQVIKTPVHDQEGNIIGIQGLVWDITDSKRVEIEVKQRLNELATITAISQAATSHLNLKMLITLVGEKILDLFDVQAAFIALYDKTSTVISFPFLQYFDERTDTETMNFGSGLTSRIIEIGKPLVINTNYLQRSVELGVVNRRADVEEAEMPKSWLGIPINVNNETIGVISVQNFARENAFSESDVRLLATIAANVGIAIQNAQLYESAQKEVQERMRAEATLRQRVEDLNIINEISQVAASQLDPQAVIALAGKNILNTFAVEAAFIAIYDKDEGLIHFPYLSYFDQETTDEVLEFGMGLTTHVLKKRKPLVINSDYMRRSTELGVVNRSESDPNEPTPKSWLGVPIIVNKETIGVVSVQNYNRENAFEESDVRLLMTIAANTGIAIENAKLFEQAKTELAERKRAEAELQKRFTEIQALQEQLREQAIRDPLTNLFNRRYLQETLERELVRAQREQSQIGIILMDIDHFKSVNDAYGHAAGDKLLIALAQLLRNLTRASDIACRYGGEEFLIMMPCSSLDATRDRAELIRQKFGEIRVEHEGRILQGTISLGVAAYPKQGTTSDEVIKRADEALYAAKSNGRNRVVLSL